MVSGQLRRAAAGLVVGGGALLASRLRREDRTVQLPAAPARAWLRPLTASCEAAAPASDLPTFTKAEVAKHAGGDAGVWVTLGNRVFDITDFIANHPGGVEKIGLWGPLPRILHFFRRPPWCLSSGRLPQPPTHAPPTRVALLLPSPLVSFVRSGGGQLARAVLGSVQATRRPHGA
jgi:hypothetical protein